MSVIEKGTPFSRRDLLRAAAALGGVAAVAALLEACGSAGTATGTSTVAAKGFSNRTDSNATPCAAVVHRPFRRYVQRHTCRRPPHPSRLTPHNRRPPPHLTPRSRWVRPRRQRLRVPGLPLSRHRTEPRACAVLWHCLASTPPGATGCCSNPISTAPILPQGRRTTTSCARWWKSCGTWAPSRSR